MRTLKSYVKNYDSEGHRLREMADIANEKKEEELKRTRENNYKAKYLSLKTNYEQLVDKAEEAAKYGSYHLILDDSDKELWNSEEGIRFLNERDTGFFLKKNSDLVTLNWR